MYWTSCPVIDLLGHRRRAGSIWRGPRQVGGPKRLADLLARHASLGMIEREAALTQELLMWKGSNAKVDDAMLVGIDLSGIQADGSTVPG